MRCGSSGSIPCSWDVALRCCALWRFCTPPTPAFMASRRCWSPLLEWRGKARREAQPFRSYVAALLAFIGLSVVLVFAINAAMAGLLDFRFWRTSLALVSIHRWNEPAAMSDAATIQLLVTLFAGGVIFLVRHFVPGDREASVTARTGFLLSAFLFAFAAMQSGLVRSDSQHVVFAVYPMMFFAGAVLFSFRSRLSRPLCSTGCRRLLCAVWTTGGGLPAIQLPLSPGANAAPVDELSRRLPRIQRCVLYGGLRRDARKPAVSYLQQHSGEHDSVVLFPYQYMFGLASGRNVAGGVLQSFLASGPYLSQFDIDGYRRAAAPAGLYFPDGDLSIAIDEVPNFTRTPDVWFWLNRHYQSEQELSPGVFGLLKDDSRAARISLQPLPLTVAAQSYPIRERSSVVDLGNPLWPIDGADFLRLRLTARYGAALEAAQARAPAA